MYKQVEKPKENKSRAVANAVSQKQSGSKSTFQFVDNRTEAVAQRKLGELARRKILQHRIARDPEGTNTKSTNPIQRFVYRKVDKGWVKIEESDAPTVLRQTLTELGIEYHAEQDVISNIYDSDEYRILLYNPNDKAAIRSEIEAIVKNIRQEPKEEGVKGRKKGTWWRTGKVDKAFKATAKEDPDGFDTGHHKLAKSKIQWLYDLLTVEQRENLAMRLDLPSGSGVNALKSLYSNLTFGPGSGDREDDPLQGFDPNYHTPPKLERTLTPRSLQYSNLDGYLDKLKGLEKKSIAPEEFDYIANCFENAEKLHAVITEGGGLDKNRLMWSKSENNDEWIKGDLPTPIDLDKDPSEVLDKLRGNSVRELKNPDQQAKEEGFSLTKEDRERLIEQLHPVHVAINKKLEEDPENIHLRLSKAMIMHEIMDLMRMKR